MKYLEAKMNRGVIEDKMAPGPVEEKAEAPKRGRGRPRKVPLIGGGEATSQREPQVSGFVEKNTSHAEKIGTFPVPENEREFTPKPPIPPRVIDVNVGDVITLEDKPD